MAGSIREAGYPLLSPKGLYLFERLQDQSQGSALLRPRIRGGCAMEDMTLSCPDGYELACMKASDEDKCCCCCVSVTSPSRTSRSATTVVSGP